MTSLGTKADHRVSGTMPPASVMSASNNLILQRVPKDSGVPKESDDEWTKNEDEFSSWDSIDLDWMSRSDNDDLQIAVPTTEKTEYETKVYQQSITLLIRLQKNETSVSASGYQDPLKVGPWKVPRDSIPVLVGSITGFCFLLIFGVSLALYVCLNKRQTSKSYSVKSEASSVDSARSPKSMRSLSRDSLVLVTGPSSGHQARLLTDPSSSNNFLFDYSFDFYFNTPSHDTSSTLKKDLTTPSELKVDVSSESTSLLQRPSSFRERKFSQETESHPSSISATLHVEVIANCIHSNIDGTPSQSNDWGSRDENERGTKGDVHRPTDLALRVPHELDDTDSNHNVNQRYSAPEENIPFSGQKTPGGNFSSQDTCTTEEGRVDYRSSLPNEALKTRSLPAWVRSKSGPLASHVDLSSSLYDKSYDLGLAKRRRNRMGSDAAQVIALSKSRIRLLSPGSSTSVASSCLLDPLSRTKETGFEEFVNDAIIIYNERTAL